MSRPSHSLGRLVGVLACAWVGAAAAAGTVRLTPGFAIVAARDQHEVRLRFDPDAQNVPVQLQGQSIICRRLVKTVYAPQSRSPLAEEWRVCGVGRVLPALDRSGLFAAALLWEDEGNPVKVGDRVELGRVPAEAAKPAVLSLRVVSQRWAEKAPEAASEKVPGPSSATAAPAEEVWIVADVFCPTGETPQCEWATGAGEFMSAGGAPAGKSVKGCGAASCTVRWRAPAVAEPGSKATIRLKVTTPCRSLAAEESLAIEIQEPKGAYARVQWTPVRATGPGASRGSPPFGEASLLAAGPLGSFFLVDAPGRRLAHWGTNGPSFVALDKAPVTALAMWGDAACLAQGGQLLAWAPGAEKPQPRAKLPAACKRLVGLAANAAGDLYALDNGEPPALHVLGKAEADAWQQAPLEPKADAPWLACFALDTPSNDAYILDSRDRVVRQWRAGHGLNYRPVSLLFPVGSVADDYGFPIEILPCADADRALQPPVQLVFKSGAVTERWEYEPGVAGGAATWQPVVSRPPRELARVRFTAQRAARLADGDLLLGGQAGSGDEAAAVVAQVSPKGDLRQTLPLPQLPPRLIAAAPDGQRYLLLVRRTQRLVVLSPDGWVARDLGDIEAIQSVQRVRPDRASPDHVFLVGEKGNRSSAFRLNSANPSGYLELSSAGAPVLKIPDHHAVDVAMSPELLTVLDRDGRVLVFSNERTPRYLMLFETDLSRPVAIALCWAGATPQPYVCVLPSGRSADTVHVWQLRTAGGGKPTVVKIGPVAGLGLSAPVTLDTGFPDHPERLYVLDRGGAQVRALDLPALIAQKGQAAATPLIDKLPIEGGAGDMAVGPGQVVHIVDTAAEAIYSYSRRP